MKKILKYFLIGFFGLIVLGVVLGGSGTKDKTASNSTGTGTKTDEAKSTAQPQEIQKVEVAAFIKEFDENQLAAEAKYKDKFVEFSGYIKNISEDILGAPFLVINPKADQYYFGTYIQCFFKDKADLISLKNGQKVSLQGKFTSQTLGIIIIKECKAVQ